MKMRIFHIFSSECVSYLQTEEKQGRHPGTQHMSGNYKHEV